MSNIEKKSAIVAFAAAALAMWLGSVLTGCASLTHTWPDGSQTRVSTFAKKINGRLSATDSEGNPITFEYSSDTKTVVVPYGSVGGQ